MVNSEISVLLLLFFSRFWIRDETIKLFLEKIVSGMSIRMLRSVLLWGLLGGWNSWLCATWEFINCFAV